MSFNLPRYTFDLIITIFSFIMSKPSQPTHPSETWNTNFVTVMNYHHHDPSLIIFIFILYLVRYLCRAGEMVACGELGGGACQ